ncbi:MAG: serine protease, partial [Alphaproteobacteria bacterium]
MTFLVVLFAFSSPFSAKAQERIREVPQESMQVQLSYASLVKRVSPAVVNIYTKRTVRTGVRSPFMNDPFFGRFFNHDFFVG